jgi:hypothetical protein
VRNRREWAMGNGKPGKAVVGWHRRLWPLAALAGVVAVATTGLGQESKGVRVEARVEPSEVTVGEPFKLTVEVTAPAKVSLELPGKDADLSPAEVRSFDRQETEGAGGEGKVRLSYELALFEVGEREIKGPAITYQEEGGEATQVEWPAARVSVRSVLPEGAEDIKDIRGPKPMPLSGWQWAGLIAAGLLLAGLVAAGIVLWRRVRGREEEEQAAPPLPAHLQALADLDRLEAEDLVSRGEIKEHYVRLSWIIRRYLWRRYRLAALEETTSMLARSLRASGRAPREAEGFLPLLAEADLVKFAKHRPEDARARGDVAAARRIVKATSPREVPGAAEAEAAAAA